MQGTPGLIKNPLFETALLSAEAPEWLEDATEGQVMEWLLEDEDDRDRKLGFI